MAKLEEPVAAPDAAEPNDAVGADAMVPAELVSNTAGEYLRASFARIKGGETGILPVVGGLLLVSILFQSLNSRFLTAGNLVNLLVQAAVFSLLAMGEVFALLLGEIDLSIGFVAGISGVVLAKLLEPSGFDWPWWAAILVALLICAAVGA